MIGIAIRPGSVASTNRRSRTSGRARTFRICQREIFPSIFLEPFVPMSPCVPMISRVTSIALFQRVYPPVHYQLPIYFFY